MKPFLISFGLLIPVVLILLWLAQVDHFQTNQVDDTWVVIFAVCFLIIGVYLIKRAMRKSPGIIKHKPGNLNYSQLSKAGISRREGEILALIEEGLSNNQIADKLFVSENTVKRHMANLFQKLEVKQRHESVKKAKEMSILS